jgi:hypothetical protein
MVTAPLAAVTVTGKLAEAAAEAGATAEAGADAEPAADEGGLPVAEALLPGDEPQPARTAVQAAVPRTAAINRGVFTGGLPPGQAGKEGEAAGTPTPRRAETDRPSHEG